MKIQTILAAVLCMLYPVEHVSADMTKVECQVCATQQMQIDEMSAKIEELQQKVNSLEVRETYFKILLQKERFRERLPSTAAWTYAQYVVRYAKEYGNDIDDVLSIIFVESSYDVWAESSMGAQGAMQIMQFWKKDKECGTSDGRDDYYNLQANIRVGNCILAVYRRRFHNNFMLAALAYNKGPVLVERELKAGVDPSNGYDYKVLRELHRLKRWQAPVMATTNQELALK